MDEVKKHKAQNIKKCQARMSRSRGGEYEVEEEHKERDVVQTMTLLLRL